jgi:hypothetical protein
MTTTRTTMSSATIDVKVAFGPATPPVADDDAFRVHLPTDGERPLALRLRPHRPAIMRDALLALGDVLASDLRFKARDRADYLAYLLSKGKGVSKQVWDAQKEYLALKYSEAARAEEPLDPVLSVADDAIRLEVMSRDESTYAQLALRRDGFAEAAGPAGTTYVDLTTELVRAFGRIRTYRSTTLDLAPAGAPAPRSRNVPLRWLRAFGQMQAASLLPATRFELGAVDLYNVLLTLRMQKAKKPPRALRYELVPGEAPRLVIEPWDLVLTGTGGAYQGDRPLVVRTWGRNRLAVLARVLPHARTVRVSLAGPGLPAFYVVDLGDATLTIAMSGWTDAGWAGISTFDLLAATDAGSAGDRVRAMLERGPASIDELAATTGESRAAVRAAVVAGLGQLRLGHDLARGVIFARPLLATALPDDALRFRDAREEQAHRLLAEPGQVQLTKVHDLGADGRAIEGQITDAAAHRSFHPSFTLDREGRTSAAQCTCPAFRRAGIKEGPCEHMIAIRVLYAREQARLEEARETPEGRALIRAETRTLLRRTARGAETYRISLDDRAVISRYGKAEPLRMQRVLFTTADEARAAYFARLEELGSRGYLDGGSGD